MDDHCGVLQRNRRARFRPVRGAGNKSGGSIAALEKSLKSGSLSRRGVRGRPALPPAIVVFWLGLAAGCGHCLRPLSAAGGKTRGPGGLDHFGSNLGNVPSNCRESLGVAFGWTIGR